MNAGPDAKDALLVGALVFACSIFGICTAPPGVLAAFWPTNAVLVGLLLRRAHPPGWAHWLAAGAGYGLADLVMQHGWPKTLMLTTTNLMGVAVCYALLARMSDEFRGLRHPRSVVRFVLVASSGAAAAGVGGIFIHPALFGGTPAYGFMFWFSTELVNYIAILPVLLTMPDLVRRLAARRCGDRRDRRTWHPEQLAPLAAFAGSLWLGTQLGGPGAISFPVPAMLWCALTYSLFATAGITLLFSMWTLLAIASGALSIGASIDSPQAIMSLRVGVTLTALAPLAVASVMVARDELLARLRHAAAHDPLTQVLNRGGFMACAATELAACRTAAVLMMDIDFFKKVNDTHGHAAGDDVLTRFAQVAADCLRGGDVLGRLGGEEFAVLLPGCGVEDARAIAQRICDAFAAQPVALAGGARLHATVSIGVACRDDAVTPVDVLLSTADAALYRAKHEGRNRVVLGAACAGRAA